MSTMCLLCHLMSLCHQHLCDTVSCSVDDLLDFLYLVSAYNKTRKHIKQSSQNYNLGLTQFCMQDDQWDGAMPQMLLVAHSNVE